MHPPLLTDTWPTLACPTQAETAAHTPVSSSTREDALYQVWQEMESQLLGFIAYKMLSQKTQVWLSTPDFQGPAFDKHLPKFSQGVLKGAGTTAQSIRWNNYILITRHRVTENVFAVNCM